MGLVICFLVMTDGRREYIERTIPSMLAHLHGPITRRVIHDDSGDGVYQAWLRDRFPTFELITTPERAGFGGAIRSAWEQVRHVDERFIFATEDDFVLDRRVELQDMMTALDTYPNLQQLALRRQPWNDEERAVGGVVELAPSSYEEVDESFLQHRNFWTTNPSLFRSDVTWKHPWPRGSRSEGMFTANLLRSPKVRFGYWGARDSGVWVTHIGEERIGVGY